QCCFNESQSRLPFISALISSFDREENRLHCSSKTPICFTTVLLHCARSCSYCFCGSPRAAKSVLFFSWIFFKSATRFSMLRICMSCCWLTLALAFAASYLCSNAFFLASHSLMAFSSVFRDALSNNRDSD